LNLVVNLVVGGEGKAKAVSLTGAVGADIAVTFD